MHSKIQIANGFDVSYANLKEDDFVLSDSAFVVLNMCESGAIRSSRTPFLDEKRSPLKL